MAHAAFRKAYGTHIKKYRWWRISSDQGIEKWVGSKQNGRCWKKLTFANVHVFQQRPLFIPSFNSSLVLSLVHSFILLFVRSFVHLHALFCDVGLLYIVGMVVHCSGGIGVTLYCDSDVPSPPHLKVVATVTTRFWPCAETFLSHDSVVDRNRCIFNLQMSLKWQTKQTICVYRNRIGREEGAGKGRGKVRG